jgi:hypothetical protein
MKKPNCIYCGLPLRGKGCAYSTHKIHVVLEPGKCIYCGLPLRGKGCAYSPTKVHVQSSEFGLLQAESMKEQFIMKYIMEKLKEPVTKSQAYKLGIINEQGKQIRDLVSEQDHAAWSPLTQYIFRLKRIFGEKLDILNSELFLENANKLLFLEENIDENWDAEKYIEKTERTEKLSSDLENLLEQYYNRLKQAEKEGFSLEQIENIVLKVLNENITDHKL